MIEHTIDLSGPDGNVFAVLGLTRRWLRQLDRVDLANGLTLAGCHSYAEALERCRQAAEEGGIALRFERGETEDGDDE